MDLTTHFKEIIEEAVQDWMELNENFLCGVKIKYVGVEGNDMILDGQVGFAPSGTFIRDNHVWQFDGVFIIGSAHVGGDGIAEVYHGTMSCLNELFCMVGLNNESGALQKGILSGIHRSPLEMGESV